MTQQLDTDASTDATQTEDSAVAEMADSITTLFNETLATLLQRRDSQYAEAVAPLDAESESLAKEHAAIEKAAQSLESLLPARARQAQREADELTLAGKPAEAAVKLEEMREAERAPEAMRARQREIQRRMEAIEEEKKAEARRIFQEWYPAVQSVIRAAEHGLFIVMLQGIEASMFEFQTRSGTTRPNGVTGGLFHTGHIIGLTADEKSPEWQAGTRWYGVGGRRR